MSNKSKVQLLQQIAELIIVRASGHSEDNQRNYPLWELCNDELEKLLNRGIGGVILVGGTNTEIKHRCKTLQNWATKPLLICADVEEGIGQRFKGGTWLVPPMSIAQIYIRDPNLAIKLAQKYGQCIGKQATKLGLNWVLAPVCDINNNPDNPVINVRAWGEDPSTISELISAFQNGLRKQGVLSCAKHFPGHGDTTIDSHHQMPLINNDLKRLEKYELVPFKAAIAAGVNSIMTGHLLLKDLDPKYPATLSKIILKDLLRNRLGFKGLIVTDALIMKAISQKYKPGQAAAMAFAAGADLIMMPENPWQAIDAIYQAIDSGAIPIERLEASVNRKNAALQEIKASGSDHKGKTQNISYTSFEDTEDKELAQELVSRSLDLHHCKQTKLKGPGINLVRIDSAIECSILSKSSPSLILPELAGFKNILCHSDGVTPWQKDAESPLSLKQLGEGPFFLQIFLRGNPFRGKLNQNEPWLAAVKQLQKRKKLAGLAIFGCPYLWSQLIQTLDPSIPASYSPGQMDEAQRQVLNHLLAIKPLSNQKQRIASREFTI